MSLSKSILLRRGPVYLRTTFYETWVNTSDRPTLSTIPFDETKMCHVDLPENNIELKQNTNHTSHCRNFLILFNKVPHSSCNEMLSLRHLRVDASAGQFASNLETSQLGEQSYPSLFIVCKLVFNESLFTFTEWCYVTDATDSYCDVEKCVSPLLDLKNILCFAKSIDRMLTDTTTGPYLTLLAELSRLVHPTSDLLSLDNLKHKHETGSSWHVLNELEQSSWKLKIDAQAKRREFLDRHLFQCGI